MDERLTTTRTPELVAMEIRGYTATALSAIIEIGKRFCEIKGMLPHGEFMPWLEEHTGYKHSTVNNFMRLAAEYGEKTPMLDGLTYSKALALLALPSGEREAFVADNDVAGMSGAELKAAIKERDEARKAADEAIADAEQARMSADASEKLLEKARAQIKELEERPIDVAVQEPDEAELEKRASAIADKAIAEAAKASEQKVAELADKLAKAEAQAKKAKDKLKTASADAEQKGAAEIAAAKKEADDARAELERLRAELDAAKEQAKRAAVSGDAELAAFQLLFESVQSDVNKMRGILLKVRGREDAQLGEKLTAALLALAEKVKGCAAV